MATSNSSLKANQKRLRAGMRGPWTKWLHGSCNPFSIDLRAHTVHQNNYFTVLEATRRSVWGKITHLMISRHDNGMTDSWRDKQRIKNELCGENRTAVEVFPTTANLIDQANMAHLWVLEEGKELPFGLEWQVHHLDFVHPKSLKGKS